MGNCGSSSDVATGNNKNNNNNNIIIDDTQQTQKATKILVLFYSTYGHCVAMAKSAVEGAQQIQGVEATLKRCEETLPAEVIAKLGATEAQKAFHDIPVADPNELADYDGIIFVFPTRFGSVPAQLKSFFDATGGLWFQNKLVGKVGSVITSSAQQHGGQESTILSFHTSMFHHGMTIVGLPATWGKHGETNQVQGCSFYGASTIANADGSRMPSEAELDGAKFQGKTVAEYTKKLSA